MGISNLDFSVFAISTTSSGFTVRSSLLRSVDLLIQLMRFQYNGVRIHFRCE